jgi:L-threonylcarbamoyladenylate synthase
VTNTPVADAAKRLAAGDVIAFPTETVYGLGADATSPAAVRKIFSLKDRPADHPLIVHFADPATIGEWASEVPEAARILAQKFWPGPLTIILRKSARIPASVTGGQDTVGLRCPSHPVAQELLREFARIGSGVVAAPSANKFGHVSPTTAQHVRDEFGEALLVLDGGACDVGLESTIVDLSRGAPVLLRPGAVTREAIAEALGEAPRDRDENAPRASGTLAAHYAPQTPLLLVASADLAANLLEDGAAVLAFGEPPAESSFDVWIEAPADAVRYGHDLYANLRALDASGSTRILVETPPGDSAWEAVNDRLARAAAAATASDAT